MATTTLTRSTPAARGQVIRQPRRKPTIGKAVAVAVAAVLALLWLVPFAWAAVTAFKTEADAKTFALEILAKGWSATAGTLNPHQPKRVIGASQIEDWAAPHLR